MESKGDFSPQLGIFFRMRFGINTVINRVIQPGRFRMSERFSVFIRIYDRNIKKLFILLCKCSSKTFYTLMISLHCYVAVQF